MKPIESVQELRRLKGELSARRGADVVIRVCSTGCRALGALDVCEALEREITRQGAGDRAAVLRVGCHGLCAGAVTLVIDPKGIFYRGVTPDDAAEIVEQTVLAGKIIRRLCWSDGKHTFSRQRDIPFYRNQTRLVLRNCGAVNPGSLEDALAHGAYQAAAGAISTRSPEEVIAQVQASGLRGRGGAGFPTGRKWQSATPTRATRARSWTGRCSRATPTWCWKG
jgi:NADP-reducing hydrogenase subunit HndC